MSASHCNQVAKDEVVYPTQSPVTSPTQWRHQSLESFPLRRNSSIGHIHYLHRHVLGLSRPSSAQLSASRREHREPTILNPAVRSPAASEVPPLLPINAAPSSVSEPLVLGLAENAFSNDHPQGLYRDGDVAGNVIAAMVVAALVLGGLIGLVAEEWNWVDGSHEPSLDGADEVVQDHQGHTDFADRASQRNRREGFMRRRENLDPSRFSAIYYQEGSSGKALRRPAYPQPVTGTTQSPDGRKAPCPRVSTDVTRRRSAVQDRRKIVKANPGGEIAVTAGNTLQRSLDSDSFLSAQAPARIKSLVLDRDRKIMCKEETMYEDTKSSGSSAPDMTSDDGSSRRSTSVEDDIGAGSVKEEVFELRRVTTRKMRMNKGVLVSFDINTAGSSGDVVTWRPAGARSAGSRTASQSELDEGGKDNQGSGLTLRAPVGGSGAADMDEFVHLVRYWYSES
ncbi:hypothetical protein BU15DRAFT_73369 [Melanogaster broomeanus]|nr:hypothetical protein BU15DRAFT_73369 [Melanogaster broomeanus]